MNFFKRLFGKKQKDSKEFKLDELEDWIKDNSPIFKNFKDIFNKIDIETKEANIKLDNLENINFPKDADEYIKKRVKDNIEAYSRQIRLFLNKINIDITLNFQSINEFCNNLEQDLEKLNKGTSKSFYIIQLLFNNDVSKVASSIKKISDLNRELIEIPNRDDSLIWEGVLLKINKLRTGYIFNERLQKELNEKEKLLEQNHSELEELNKKRSELEISEEYTKLISMRGERDELEKEMYELKNEVINLFGPLDKALKKFIKTGENEILEEYADSPLTLFKDYDLIIIDELKKIEKAILDNKIDLDEKKREKVLKIIQEINHEKLRGYVDKENDIEDKIKQFEKDIFANPILKEEINMEYKLKSLKLKSIRFDEELSLLKKRSEKVDVDSLKSEIEENLVNVFNFKIKII